MFRRSALLLAALACMGAAAPAKGPVFDARDPATLIGMLATMDAKAEIDRTTTEDVFLKVATPAYGFTVQFAGCNAQHKACKAVAFAAEPMSGAATLPQINGFNQTSVLCRAWQDRSQKPHVTYATLVSAQDTRAEMTTILGAWQGCLANFGEFLADPNGYLSAAP